MQATIKDDMGQVLQIIGMSDKVFKSGSIGYYGNGKIPVNGDRYQASVMLVKIGSKPKVKTESKTDDKVRVIKSK